MTRANYGSQKEQNSHRESTREKKKMRLNHRLLFWSPNLNPQIDLKTRLGKAKKMPKQPQFPALGRGPPFQSHPPAPKQFGFSFPRFAHFQASPPPAPVPALPRTDQEMAHGSKFIILSHTLLTHGRGCQRKRLRPPRPAAYEGRGSAGTPRGARARGARAARPDFKGGRRGRYFRGTCGGGRALPPRGWNPPPPGSAASPRPAATRLAEGGGAAAVI